MEKSQSLPGRSMLLFVCTTLLKSGLSERLLRCLFAEREKPNVPKHEILSNIKLKRAKFKFPSWENMGVFDIGLAVINRRCC